MREHEVPTHVQAEDRVLLGFTFPQIVAVVAVCAIAYGAYRYAPVGPSEVRLAIAVLFGLVGIAMAVGKIGGRRLPLVAADLLKYRLGARLYAGSVSQLVRAEPPAPPQTDRSGPGPLRLMAKKTRRVFRNLRSKKRNRRKDRRNGRMPFRPHGWFGKRHKNGRHGQATGHIAETLQSTRGKPLRAVGIGRRRPPCGGRRGRPPGGPGPEPGGRAMAGRDRLRANGAGRGTPDIRQRAVRHRRPRMDHPEGRHRPGHTSAGLRRAGGKHPALLGRRRSGSGQTHQLPDPLDGPAPSFTVSWEDDLGQAGALTIDSEMIPYPLPEAEGEVCSVRLSYLEWTPGVIHGTLLSECAAVLPEPVEVRTVAGHADVTQTILADAEVTAIKGTIAAAAGPWTTSVPFVPGVETNVQINVPAGEALHAVTMDVSFEASLRIPIPPLVELTHHPERTELRTETVSLWRPGATESVSQTITVDNGDGTTTDHTVTATAHIPGETVYRDISMTVVHPEHVRAEVVERSPVSGSREEQLSLAAVVGSDDPYEALALPEPEPEDPPAEQEPARGLRGWFEQLGWEWPW